jgi:hypothetical protein
MLRYGPDAAPVDPGIEHHGVAQFVRALRGTSQQLEVDTADDLGVLLREPNAGSVRPDAAGLRDPLAFGARHPDGDAVGPGPS